MNNLNDIMEFCDEQQAEDYIYDMHTVLSLTTNIISRINEFVESCGVDWKGYPMEYFSRDRGIAQEALSAFADILCELEDFVDD